jgi:hypothetical protein
MKKLLLIGVGAVGIVLCAGHCARRCRGVGGVRASAAQPAAAPSATPGNS